MRENLKGEPSPRFWELVEEADLRLGDELRGVTSRTEIAAAVARFEKTFKSLCSRVKDPE